MITETRQYMTSKLGDELFAIDVARVREVLEVAHITQIVLDVNALFSSGDLALLREVVPESEPAPVH